MKALITAIAFASATCILAAPVLAAKVEKKDDKKGKEMKGNPKSSFKSLDKDGDGFLDKQEFAGLGSSGAPLELHPPGPQQGWEIGREGIREEVKFYGSAFP